MQKQTDAGRSHGSPAASPFQLGVRNFIPIGCLFIDDAEGLHAGLARSAASHLLGANFILLGDPLGDDLHGLSLLGINEG